MAKIWSLSSKWERLPGGEVAGTETSEVVLYICRMTKTYLHIPASEKTTEVTMTMDADECLLRLPADVSDIPAVVSLVASRAAKRRKR